MTTAATREEIVELFHSGSPAELREFIRNCPEFPLRDEAAEFVKSEMPGGRTLALGMVGQGLAFGRNVELGAEASLAAHTLAREDFDKYGPDVILPVTVSRHASEALHALNVAGRYEEALAFADEVIPLYDDELENGPTIRVAKITALFALNRIGEVKRLIGEERARGTKWPSSI